MCVCTVHGPSQLFLDAMSSSRSDNVTKCVSSFVHSSLVILFSLKHPKHLKQDVLRELEEGLRSFCLKFQGCSRKFQGCFMEV